MNLACLKIQVNVPEARPENILIIDDHYVCISEYEIPCGESWHGGHGANQRIQEPCSNTGSHVSDGQSEA